MNYNNERERQLNSDWDNDRLPTRQELIKLNSYSADTELLGVLDSKGGLVSSAIESNSQRDELRERYLDRARTILNRPNLNYDDLYREVGGDQWLAKGIDQAVLSAELSQGQSLTQASLLLAKSPFVQYMQKQGQLQNDEVQNYLISIVESQKSALH